MGQMPTMMATGRLFSPQTMLFPPATCRRLIVKIGSALLVDGDGSVRAAWLAQVARDIGARVAAGQQVAVVSSGAIALGARRLALARGGRASLEDAQAAAAVGQIALSQIWAQQLADAGLTAAQILLTIDDLENRRRYLNAAATLERLLSLGAVPVINENDSVATSEIRFGDNDRLAARVGQAARADGILLLSDIDGLYDRNPAEAGAQHIAHIAHIDARIRAMADGGSASGMGSGGMASKIAAAEIAGRAGIDLAIASGKLGRPLGEDVRHSMFTAPRTRGRARKNWLAGRLVVRGQISIDAGAARALAGGASLLAVGVRAVGGRFQRGDVVDVIAPDGQIVARGLAEYDAADAARLIGLASDAQAAILGYAPRSAIIHRDHLVLL